jgi:hypothetical protein
MGLDVSIYRNCKEVAAGLEDEDRSCFKVFASEDWPGREAPLHDGKSYQGDDLPDDAPDIGCGYISYSHWRNQLAEMAGYPRGSDDAAHSYCEACWDGAQGPFAELINFSDCEGFIGSTAAKKLAADFAEFQAKADAFTWHRPELYGKFRRAFEIAAEDGCVQFH